MASITREKRRTAKGEITRWRVAYKDAAGVRRSKKFDRAADAKDYRTKVESDLAAGVHVADRETITFREASERWLDACRRGRGGRAPVEPHTIRMYESLSRNHVVPALGALRLTDLSPARVKQFRDVDMIGAGKSRSLTKKALKVVSAICREAIGDELLSVNPCAAIDLVESGRHKERVEIPSKDDVRKILDRAREWISDPPVWPGREYQVPAPKRARWFSTLLRFLASTGVRPSEARGAPLDALDMERGTFTVRQRADETGRIGNVKSAAGRRVVLLSAAMVEDLREWLKVRPEGSGLLFPNTAGKVESLSNISSRFWLPLLVDCGIATRDPGGRHVAPFTIYALRHFFVSLMIETGIEPKLLSEMIGHASITMTLDVYGHLFKDEGAFARKRAAFAAATGELDARNSPPKISPPPLIEV